MDDPGILATAAADGGNRVLIRLVLIAGAGLLLAYVMRRRSLLADRMVGLLLFALAVVTIIYPDSTMVVARWFGVGRGTDLIVYLSFLLFSFIAAVVFARLGELNRRVTVLTRHIAIITAEKPDKDKH